MVLGDFNSILNSQERVGAKIRPQHFSEFLDCVNLTGLSDERYRGNFLTWSNKQENQIWCKLDRSLINGEWLGEYPDYDAKFLNPGAASDYSSMVVVPMNQVDTRKKSFRFFNFCVEEEVFITTVKKAWQHKVKGNPMYVLMQKLKVFKKLLT